MESFDCYWVRISVLQASLQHTSLTPLVLLTGNEHISQSRWRDYWLSVMLEVFLSLEGTVFNRSPGEIRKRNCGKEARTGTMQSTVRVFGEGQWVLPSSKCWAGSAGRASCAQYHRTQSKRVKRQGLGALSHHCIPRNTLTSKRHDSVCSLLQQRVFHIRSPGHHPERIVKQLWKD